MKLNRSKKSATICKYSTHNTSITISIHNSLSLSLSCYQLHNFLNHNFFIFFNHFLVYMKNVPLVVLDFVISKEFNKNCRFMKFLLIHFLLLDFSIEWVHKVLLLITALFPRIPTTKREKDDSDRGISSELRRFNNKINFD